MLTGTIWKNFLNIWFIQDILTKEIFVWSGEGTCNDGDIIEFEVTNNRYSDNDYTKDYAFAKCVRVVKSRFDVFLEQKQLDDEIHNSNITHIIYVYKQKDSDLILVLGCVERNNLLYTKNHTRNCSVIHDIKNNVYFRYSTFDLKKCFCTITKLE